MFPTPVPFAVPFNPLVLESRMKQLEEALLASFELIDRLGGCLKSKFGEDCLGHNWLRSTNYSDQDRAEVDQLSALIAEENFSNAARVFREKTGATWDEAHAIVKHWNIHSREEMTRRLRLARWMRAIGSLDGNKRDDSQQSE